MNITNLEVFNFKGAFRGMRNPMESWDKSDSDFINGTPLLGLRDIELAQKLICAGDEHRKFLRQIIVSFDLTAPLYFWKEFDTYKVGTTANSTSTMHRLATTPITVDCFEMDDFNNLVVSSEENLNEIYELTMEDILEDIIYICENLRQKYLKTNDKAYWKELIRWLPESWLQTRTITMNYENILNLIHQRKNHKLSEWHYVINYFKEHLPYAYELIFFLEGETNETN